MADLHFRFFRSDDGPLYATLSELELGVLLEDFPAFEPVLWPLRIIEAKTSVCRRTAGTACPFKRFLSKSAMRPFLISSTTSDVTD